MADKNFNPAELEVDEIEEALASADLDLDDEEETDTETAEEGEEEVENELKGDETDESEEEGEETVDEDEIDEVLKALEIDTAKEGEKESESETENELTEQEEEDLLSKLLENPEEVIESLVEKKLEERLRQETEQQRMMEEKWNTFLTQAEEVSKEFHDFDEVMDEGVLAKLAEDPKNAALVLEAENIAEAAYYYAKFGTPIPSAKQLKELLTNQPASDEEEGEKKEAPKPPKGKAVGVVDEDVVPDTLDTADLDF